MNQRNSGKRLSPALSKGPSVGDAPALGGTLAERYLERIDFKGLQRMRTARREVLAGDEAGWRDLRAEISASVDQVELSYSNQLPMALLARFPALSLEPGYQLVSVRTMTQWGGRARVWAVSERSSSMTWDWDEPAGQVRPRGGDDAFMRYLRAQPSAWGYFSAALFAREVDELGSSWHGVSWGDHTVLVDVEHRGSRDLPSDVAFAVLAGEQARSMTSPWQWATGESPPSAWSPLVQWQAQEEVVVTFYTFSRHVHEGLYRHTDRFAGQGLAARSTRETIATGGRGYIC